MISGERVLYNPANPPTMANPPDISKRMAKGVSAYTVRKSGFLKLINCLAKNVMPTDHIAIPKEARSNHRLSPIPG
tara:strand:+ start:121 stop:348 length:228 start_codon:yes stop_codon:yes gene_type:complete